MITFVGWVGVEALGPILCNIGNDFGITDMVKIICRASFYTTLIMLILSIFWRKTYLVAIITSTIYGAFAYANLLYFRSFNQYFPLNLLTEFQQLEGLGTSIFSLIRWADILFIFATIIPIITYRYLRPYIHNFSIRNHLIALLAICFMTAIPSIGTSKLLHIGELHKSVNWIIACEPTRAYKVYGLMPIIAYQTTNTNNKSLILNDDERDVIACQIKEKCADFLNMQPYSIYQKQNLVLMLMESLNTSCIMPDVMPTLSSLCSQATTLYCPQVTQMTQGAMSIGGQLTVLSGLNGLRTSVFTTDYPH
ncbi:MAG: hypothetical protein IIV91_00995, partial [Alistipes sp.]|nr:hypothetical protein [Alistipes sp.]